jgi:phage tail sheath protein FI
MALSSGVLHIRDGVEPQTVLGSEMSVIGILGTADSAEAAKIPLNEPVYLLSNDKDMRTALGSEGTLPEAIEAVSAQLTGTTKAAKIVVVRVAHNADPATVIANLVGSEAGGTGMWALLDAPTELGVTPRCIVAPGYTSQTLQGLGNVTVSNAGTGGTDGTFDLAFSGGTGSGGEGTFTVTSGSITSVEITTPGEYTVVPTLDFSASSGLTDAAGTVDLQQLANAVVAAIPTVLERLKAVFLPEGPTSTRQAYLDYVETLPRSHRILHPLRNDAKALDDVGDVVTRPMSPYIIGLYARRDYEKDGVPSGSIHNQPVYGLVGVSPNVAFSWTDETAEGQEILAMSGGLVARGEVGVDGAVSDGGFVFLGTDTLSSESEWMFANVVRMRDYVELAQAKALIPMIGRQNITLQSVEMVLDTIKLHLTKLVHDGHILAPFKVDFPAGANTPEEIRAGEIDLVVAFEEPPVLRKLIIRSRRHREAINALTQTISIKLNASSN